MKQRLLVAGIGLPALLAVLLVCPAWATMVLVCGIAGVAAYELLHTAGKIVPAIIYTWTIMIALIQEVYIYSGSDAFAIGPVSSVTMIRWYFVVSLFVFSVVGYGRGEGREVSFTTLCIAVVGGIVFPTMYSCIFLLRMHETFGKVYVLAPFFVAFAGDTLSMFFGMWFGKRKMAPHVSPNKTWAGFIGGPIGSALGMCLLGFLGTKCFGYTPNYLLLVVVGVAANLLGQLGDLSMSLIKRENGVKDYSHLFLTHGGMLDRFDSTMFIAPVVYFFVSAGVI